MALHCKVTWRGKLACHSQDDCDEVCERELEEEQEKLNEEKNI